MGDRPDDSGTGDMSLRSEKSKELSNAKREEEGSEDIGAVAVRGSLCDEDDRDEAIEVGWRAIGDAEGATVVRNGHSAAE